MGSFSQAEISHQTREGSIGALSARLHVNKAESDAAMAGNMKKIVGVETIHNGWTKLRIANIRLESGEVIRREIEDHGRAVSVLPYDPGRKCAMMIRQFRPPVFLAAKRQELLEAIAGIAEGKKYADCAKREAFEEAGLSLKKLEHVGCVWTMPGISTERLDLFLAAYSEADRTGAGGGLAEEHEDITLVEMPLAELASLADRGKLEDVKTMLLVQTLRLKRPDLFI
jgi:nudix-type nucleoside diphosphatase (YffH/AdpP family)